MSVQTTSHPTPQSDWLWHAGLFVFFIVWWLIYRQLISLSELVTSLFPVERHSHTGEAIAFFFYDVPKVMMLLTLIVFAMGVVRSYFSAAAWSAGVLSMRKVPFNSKHSSMTPWQNMPSRPTS